MDDRGSVSVLVAGFMILLVMVGAGAVRVAEATALHRAAQTAAEAAALAAVRGPARVREVAQANGATLVGVTRGPGWVEVEVDRHGARAGARASLGLPVVPGRAEGGLSPLIVAALHRAEAMVGRAIPIVSGYRSPGEQAALWARRFTNPFPVAPPGSSAHESGLAVDLSVADAALVESLRVGLCRPYASDPVHLELCPGR